MKNKKFLEESARDIIALGSPVFFIIALVRISITNNYSYLGKVALAGFLFLTLAYFFKANVRLGFGFILVVFLSLYYNSAIFTIFASLIYLSAIASMIYLKEDKAKIIKGIFFGLVSAGISWFAVEKLFVN